MGWKNSLKCNSQIRKNKLQKQINKMRPDPYNGAWTSHTTLSGKIVPMAASSYKAFADNYRIPLGTESFIDVRNKILRHELEHKEELIKSGIRGLFINSDIE